MEDRGDSGVTLAELLAAFSLATDLGLGQPMEHVLRSWQIAARLGRAIELPEEQRAPLFYVAMMAWVGCVADSPEVTSSFGDDIAFRAASYDVDLAGLPGMAYFLSHTGAGQPVGRRLLAGAGLVAKRMGPVIDGLRSHCLTTSTLAEQLDLESDVSVALRQFFARWDRQGVPDDVGGEEIALPVRLFHLGDVAEVHHRRGGVDGATRVVQARRGTQFDPALVDAFCAGAAEVLGGDPDVLDVATLVAAEPGLATPLSEERLDDALTALADFTDLRSIHRAGHSRGVADLADAAARQLNLPAADARLARRAGLVHDVGLHGVPATILDKAEALSASEQERLRACSYYTERVLARPPALARIGRVAAATNERLDGSGHHRGVTASDLSLPARILAVACEFRSLVEPRPGRVPLPLERAAASLRAEAGAGRLDVDAVDAVLTVAGAGSRRRAAGPAGLTSREIEVLSQIARGATTRQVARTLGITPKTADTHIERIYAKTGASSRSTAMLFALRHGLLDPLEL